MCMVRPEWTNVCSQNHLWQALWWHSINMNPRFAPESCLPAAPKANVAASLSAKAHCRSQAACEDHSTTLLMKLKAPNWHGFYEESACEILSMREQVTWTGCFRHFV